MIKLEELRLGNYVLTESSYGDSMIIQINGITSTSIHGVASIMDLSVSGMTADDIKPIPLTEEILLNCGFHKLYFSEGQYEYENGFCLSFMFERGRIYENSDMCNCSREFSFLHEVQNYIFAKTGQEVEVKL